MAAESSPPSPASETRQDEKEQLGMRCDPKSASPCPMPQQNIFIPKIMPISSKEPPSTLAEGLEGKFVDEFGNILGSDGAVLGRAEGDLPSMVGRPVSKEGSILDGDGEVAGYVSENFTRPSLRELDRGLKVDDGGNIYQDGKVVGTMHASPAPSESSTGKQAGQGADAQPHDSSSRPSAAPSPSEIYLDVKSTHDGIQLIIKIPTVFNREQSRSE